MASVIGRIFDHYGARKKRLILCLNIAVLAKN